MNNEINIQTKRKMKNENLIQKLKSKSGNVRNEAAKSLMQLRNESAKIPLLEAALNKKNIGNSGTLVYALEAFDCSDCFSTLFDLVIFGNYEVKCMALGILFEQEFRPSNIEVLAAEYKVKSLMEDRFRFEDKEKWIYSLSKIIRNVKKRKLSTKKGSM